MKRSKWVLLIAIAFLPFLFLAVLPQKPLSKEESVVVSAVRKAAADAPTAAALPATAAVADSPAEAKLLAAATEGERAQVRALSEILTTGNDNDPRLDKELKTLTPRARELFRARYTTTPREGLNQRGTVVYLLGRNLETDADFDFMDGVISQPRCLSLADCSKPAAEVGHSDADGHDHHGSTEAITAAYPQLTALKALEAILARGTAADAHALARARDGVTKATRSEDPTVAGFARRLAAQYRL